MMFCIKNQALKKLKQILIGLLMGKKQPMSYATGDLPLNLVFLLGRVGVSVHK
jgi:hypothetical protein